MGDGVAWGVEGGGRCCLGVFRAARSIALRVEGGGRCCRGGGGGGGGSVRREASLPSALADS